MYTYMGFPGGSVSKEPACSEGDTGFDPCIKKALQLTPVVLPEESHGRRNLAACGPQGHKKLDTTETTERTCTYTYIVSNRTISILQKELMRISLRFLSIYNQCALGM